METGKTWTEVTDRKEDQDPVQRDKETYGPEKKKKTFITCQATI